MRLELSLNIYEEFYTILITFSIHNILLELTKYNTLIFRMLRMRWAENKMNKHKYMNNMLKTYFL